MAASINTPAVAPGPLPPGVNTDVPGEGYVPFNRAATPIRTSVSIQDSKTLTTATQPITNSLPGSGFLVWIDNVVTLTSTGNTATVATATGASASEDQPWAALSSITLDDGGPQSINIDGFGLYLVNIYGGGWAARDPALSTDTNVYSAITSGTATGAGSGSFRLRVPVAINGRNFWGLMGNQDRATKYNLRTDLAGSGSIYSTAPAGGAVSVTIARAYGFLPVPSAVAADGRRQEQIPPTYGIVHYLTKVQSDATPQASSVINHYIRNLSNAVRLFILELRSNGLRSTANSNLPTQIDFLLGTDVIWSESAATRRYNMWCRYGFDAPNGVLVYDCISDFGMLAGMELGDHYLYLGNISEAQFRITYPSGWTNASSSLKVTTDSLYIPPGVDIYAAAA